MLVCRCLPSTHRYTYPQVPPCWPHSWRPATSSKRIVHRDDALRWPHYIVRRDTYRMREDAGGKEVVGKSVILAKLFAEVQ